MKITKETARKFLLYYHHLNTRPLKGKEGIMEYFNQVGSIQFDPLSVIDTNPHLVLQSRVQNYRRDDLTELLYKDQLLIDDWDKCLCIYKRSDWPNFSLYRKKGFRNYGNVDFSNNTILEDIKNIILEKGPISTKDLKEYNEKVDWFWGEQRLAKVALETMYLWGDVIIHHKEGNRKFYDLTEMQMDKRLLKQAENEMTDVEFFQFIVKRRIGSMGLLWNRSGDAWLGIYKMKSKDRNQAIETLVRNGDLKEIFVENIPYPFYMRTKDFPLLMDVLNGVSIQNKVSFIAPLDNFIWDRKLIKTLFDFSYIWEVYKPEKERQYGYYVLPVLYKDRFIARFEPRFNKKTRVLEIHNWWYEKAVKETVAMKKAIEVALNRFKRYLSAKDIIWLNEIYKER